MSVFLAVGMLLLAGFLVWKKHWYKMATVAAIVAGTGASQAGMFGHFVQLGVRMLTQLAGVLTLKLFGSALPSLLAIALAVYVGWDMFPKHKATAVTVVAGFLLPIFVVSVAVFTRTFTTGLTAG